MHRGTYSSYLEYLPIYLYFFTDFSLTKQNKTFGLQADF